MTIFKDPQSYFPEIVGIIEKEQQIIPNLQTKWFPLVLAERSNSSYGRWVVKYSPSHFRFFWEKIPAQCFALAWNVQQGSVKL